MSRHPGGIDPAYGEVLELPDMPAPLLPMPVSAPRKPAEARVALRCVVCEETSVLALQVPPGWKGAGVELIGVCPKHPCPGLP